MARARVAVVGAGMGGLAAAAALARQGQSVTVFERAPVVGGKVAIQEIHGRFIDTGPTVVTMRWALEEVFRAAGARLDDYVTLHPLAVIGRHFWPDGGKLDLHTDIERSVDAIARFAGAHEAQSYVRFARHAEQIHEFVDQAFIRNDKPTLGSTMKVAIERGPRSMLRVDAHRTMHDALRSFFKDPRLIQLFGRYATYCGSSPYDAPATLNVVSHVERAGVSSVAGGVSSIPRALAMIAEQHGAEVRLGVHVDEIVTRGGAVTGVIVDGQMHPAEAVVFNGDANALAHGLLGRATKRAAAVTKEPSLSAFTLATLATFGGPELAHHNVFFSSNYRREFDELARGKIPTEPTVYLCTPDRTEDAFVLGEAERAFAIVNAPAMGAKPLTREETSECEQRIWNQLSTCGLTHQSEHAVVASTPASFAHRFPGTDGAIYGPATKGMLSTFQRAGARSPIRGLYLCGGSVHPGAGVPMAALSGKLAARAILTDLGSTARSAIMAMAGGTSTC